MASVAVVTDTTHYLPREMVRAAGVQEVSLYVSDGDRHEREADMPTFEAFYERLRSSAEVPTTSQPSIGDFLSVYEPLADEGHDIVSIHISGGISGTVESARQAAAELERRGAGSRIRVMDSGSACGGMGAIVLAAAAAARGGADAGAVAARAEAAKEATKIWFAVDTLEYLRRGGRIGSAQAWVGGALKVKPILTLDNELVPIERVRTSRRAFERMIDYLHDRKADGATAWMVQHIRALDQAEKVVERGREIFDSEPLFVSEIGPVIGAHAGPGLLGVAGIPPALLAER
jgi:fatty acid kinase fatty acid binding subunit